MTLDGLKAAGHMCPNDRVCTVRGSARLQLFLQLVILPLFSDLFKKNFLAPLFIKQMIDILVKQVIDFGEASHSLS